MCGALRGIRVLVGRGSWAVCFHASLGKENNSATAHLCVRRQPREYNADIQTGTHAPSAS